MKNIFGKEENLKLYDKEGKLVYGYYINSDGDSYEETYDSFGNRLTYKNSRDYFKKYTRDSFGNPLTFEDSDGSSYEYTRDSEGNILTYKHSRGFSYEYTRDSEGNELTYEDSYGVKRGFDIPEYTMNQIVEKIGKFKLVYK